MEIEAFITQSIVAIDKSLKSVNEATEETYLFTKWITEGKGNILFELTVYAEKENDFSGSWSIQVCSLAGIKTKWIFKRRSYTTSKISFSVSRQSK